MTTEPVTQPQAAAMLKNEIEFLDRAFENIKQQIINLENNRDKANIVYQLEGVVISVSTTLKRLDTIHKYLTQ